MPAQTRREIRKDEIHSVLFDPAQLHGSVDGIHTDANAMGVGVIHMASPELCATVYHGCCAETAGDRGRPQYCMAYGEKKCPERTWTRKGGKLSQEAVVK